MILAAVITVLALIAVTVVVVVVAVVAPFGGKADTDASIGALRPSRSASATGRASGPASSADAAPSWTRAYAADAQGPVRAAMRLDVALTSLRAQVVDRQLRHVETLATPAYRAQITSIAGEFARVARSTRLVSHAHVDDVALADLDATHATVLVASTSISTSTAHQGSQPTSYHLRVAVERMGGRWLVDGVVFDGAPASPATSAPTSALLDAPPFDSVGDHLAAVLSYTPDDIATDYDAESRYLTGDFARQYRALRSSLVVDVRRDHVTSKATVLDVGVVPGAGSATQPQALIFYSTTTRSDRSTAPTTTASAALATSTRGDDGWRISDLATVS